MKISTPEEKPVAVQDPSWRTLRRVLFGSGSVLILIALFYGLENWRGGRAWKLRLQELRAQGKPVDFKATQPPPVLPDQNFAAIPLIQSWFINKPLPEDRYSRAAAVLKLDDPKKPKEFHRRALDLPAWQKAFEATQAQPHKEVEITRTDNLDAQARAAAAPAILQALKENEEVLAELRLASGRPYSVYPVRYLDFPPATLLPHLAKFKYVLQRLQLRTSAELALDQHEQAAEDVQFGIAFAQSLREDPFIISHLVRFATFQIMLQPVWEGLVEHRWQDAELKEFIDTLGRTDFLSSFQKSMDAERAAGLSTIEYIRTRGGADQLFGSSDAGFETAALGFVFQTMPRGWYDWEKVNLCDALSIAFRSGYNPARQQIIPGVIKINAKEAQARLGPDNMSMPKQVLRHVIFSRLLFPSLGGMLARCAGAQVTTHEAAIACAIERYRLANGRLPATLKDLAPKFMSSVPNDVLTGDPYQYRVLAADRYVLYSVGWNEKDDGGRPGRNLVDQEEGDWVWACQ